VAVEQALDAGQQVGEVGHARILADGAPVCLACPCAPADAAAHARAQPAPSLRAMRDDDLKAIYRYNKSLGPRGVAAPAYVPPGGKVATPYLDLNPKNLPQQAAK
jgi:hypothetical protein